MKAENTKLKSLTRFNFRRWCDEWVLAAQGILLATRERKFWYGFVPAFLGFGTLMNLMESGTAKFDLMWIRGFPRCLGIVFEAMGQIFDVSHGWGDFVTVFALAFLQGVLIGLIVLLWNKKRNAPGVERAGIVTGLIALGAGCPTCGTTLITPLVGAIFSTGSMAIASTVSYIVTALAIIVALLSLKRLGEETYVIIVNEKYLRRKEHEG